MTSLFKVGCPDFTQQGPAPGDPINYLMNYEVGEDDIERGYNYDGVFTDEEEPFCGSRSRMNGERLFHTGWGEYAENIIPADRPWVS